MSAMPPPRPYVPMSPMNPAEELGFGPVHIGAPPAPTAHGPPPPPAMPPIWSAMFPPTMPGMPPLGACGGGWGSGAGGAAAGAGGAAAGPPYGWRWPYDPMKFCTLRAFQPVGSS